jgi:hypothetical protein
MPFLPLECCELKNVSQLLSLFSLSDSQLSLLRSLGVHHTIIALGRRSHLAKETPSFPQGNEHIFLGKHKHFPKKTNTYPQGDTIISHEDPTLNDCAFVRGDSHIFLSTKSSSSQDMGLSLGNRNIVMSPKGGCMRETLHLPGSLVR